MQATRFLGGEGLGLLLSKAGMETHLHKHIYIQYLYLHLIHISICTWRQTSSIISTIIEAGAHTCNYSYLHGHLKAAIRGGRSEKC